MESDTAELKIPTHVGFIMDGNRRWAKRNGKSTIEGHAEGQKVLEYILELAKVKGIKFVTFYGFSAENWSRTKDEVSGLMKLFSKAIVAKLPMMLKNNVKFNFIGRREYMPRAVLSDIKKAEEKTVGNSGVTFNLAFSYGGQDEIVDVTKKLIASKTTPGKVTRDLIYENIYETGQPDLDLIVRTGGQKRLSGFMLWQSTYAELYFTDILWPDFNESEFDNALSFFTEQKRNFGK